MLFADQAETIFVTFFDEGGPANLLNWRVCRGVSSQIDAVLVKGRNVTDPWQDRTETKKTAGTRWVAQAEQVAASQGRSTRWEIEVRSLPWRIHAPRA